MRNLVVTRCQFSATRRHEPQTAILDLKPAAIQPHQAMAVGVGNPCLLQSQSAQKHGSPQRRPQEQHTVSVSRVPTGTSCEKPGEKGGILDREFTM